MSEDLRTPLQEALRYGLMALTWVLAIAFAFVSNSPPIVPYGILVALLASVILNGHRELRGIGTIIMAVLDLLFRVLVALCVRVSGLDLTATVITLLLIEGALALTRHISRWVRDTYESVIETVGL